MTGRNDQNTTRRTRSLASVAAIGLGVGVLGLGLMAVLTADSLGGLPSLSYSAPTCDEDVPAGSPDERVFSWSGGDRVEVTLPSDVIVRHRLGDQTGQVIVRGAPRDIAHIAVTGSEIRSTCAGRFTRQVIVTLPGSTFRDVSLKGSGEVIMEALNQDDLDVSVAGSGSVTAQGQSTNATISIAGSGEVQLADLDLQKLKASIAGSGEVHAAPETSADISITGSGEVRLLSRPEDLSTSILGSGRVTQVSGGSP